MAMGTTPKPTTNRRRKMKKLIKLQNGHTVERFYNREWRSWGVKHADKNGNQIGECAWVVSEREAMNEQRALATLAE